MGLHDRLSKQNENGAANVIAERPVALAGPVTTTAAPQRAGGHDRRRRPVRRAEDAASITR